MTRPDLERRNQQVFVLVERRKIHPKQAARMMNLTYANLRVILHRIRRLRASVTICNTKPVTS